MHTKLLIPLLLLLLLLMGGCKGPQMRDDAHLLAAVKLANRDLERMFREGDYRGVADMYTDDAIILGPGGYRVEGREAIDAYWIRDWQDANWRLDVVTVTGTESMPIQVGRSQLTYRREDGEKTTATTRFTAIWRRQEDGSYRMVVDAYWKE